jgi:hypothetical protein
MNETNSEMDRGSVFLCIKLNGYSPPSFKHLSKVQHIYSVKIMWNGINSQVTCLVELAQSWRDLPVVAFDASMTLIESGDGDLASLSLFEVVQVTSESFSYHV